MPIEPLAISAYTATSAIGRGLDATVSALRSGRSGLRRCDLPDMDLDTWIGRVESLESQALPAGLRHYDCRNNRLAYLALAQDGLMEQVDRAKKRYGAQRVGLFLGTSTSGVQYTEDCYRRRRSPQDSLPDDLRYEYTLNPASLARFCGDLLGLDGPAQVVSSACSSSAKVFAAAWRHMRAGWCNAALVGGVDSLCGTTLYGFNALQLVSSGPCQPWGIERDGLNIGEGAGFVLLEWPEPGDTRPLLLGFGESSDAFHMSAPHPEGLGAALAMRAALGSAGLDPADIDYINLHGTATPANDRSEDRAVTNVFPGPPACSSTKGWTGHSLGAAGVIEATVCLLCLAHDLLPATLNTHVVDPELSVSVLTQNRHRPLRRVLSNSFGFGGSNCTLVFGRP